MKAIQLTTYGDPLNTLKLVELPDPSAPESGEVIIRMEYSPIDPSDLMLANGIYSLRPELPAVIGGQGIGVIQEIGADVNNVKVGDRVSLAFGTYAWSGLVKAPAKDLFIIAETLDLLQAAMISINPPTAVLLLDEFVKLEKGEWIALNAGNSSVANTIIAVAKDRGLKTLAIVRRKEAVEIAKNAGADVVLVESDRTAEEAKEATDGANIRLGLDAVGGAAAGTLAKILGMDSHFVVYAGQSTLPPAISQFDLIYKRMVVRGFWMFLPEYLPKLFSAKEQSAELIASGAINVPIAATYSLAEITDAVAHTIRGEKVILDFTRPLTI